MPKKKVQKKEICSYCCENWCLEGKKYCIECEAENKNSKKCNYCKEGWCPSNQPFCVVCIKNCNDGEIDSEELEDYILNSVFATY